MMVALAMPPPTKRVANGDGTAVLVGPPTACPGPQSVRSLRRWAVVGALRSVLFSRYCRVSPAWPNPANVQLVVPVQRLGPRSRSWAGATLVAGTALYDSG